jgi:predicted TIM-barrel fold metal-dependent hydrolase
MVVGRVLHLDAAHYLEIKHERVARLTLLVAVLARSERFPRLKIVSAENDVAWMAYLMWRMDFAHDRLGSLATVKLPMKPSEYIKRQVYATFINEPVFTSELHRYGPDNIMWSSDYPHLAATFPRSQQFIDSIFSGVAADQRQKIVHDTAARVYGISD